MKIRVVREIILKEIRSIVRDKKSLMKLIITPFIIPAFVFFMSYLYGNVEDVIIEGAQKVGYNYELSAPELTILSEIDIEMVHYDTKEEMDKAYSDKDIVAYIDLDDKGEYTVYMNNNDQTGSLLAGSYAMGYLEAYNNYLGNNYLIGENIDTEKVYHAITYKTGELSDGSSYMVNMIISFAMTYSLMVVMLAAIYGSCDSVAGEKERGTLETMLTFPISNFEIMAGKYLAIFLTSLATAGLALFLSYGSVGLSAHLFEIYKGINLSITVGSILLTLLTLVTGCVICSGLCIAITSFCNTFKEAQEALSPLSMLTIIPMFLSMLNIGTPWWVYLIPICGQGMMLDNIIYGKVNTLDMVVLLISSVIFSIILLIYIAKRYKSEKAIFGG